MKNKTAPNLNAAKHAELIKAGIESHARGELQTAERQFQTVLRDNPRHPEALNRLGILVLEANATDMSIEFLTRAVKAAPKEPNYRNNLANSFIAAHQHLKALPHLRKALALKPKFFEALMNLGLVYREMESGQEAANAFTNAIKLNPNSLIAKTTLADTLLDLGKNDEAYTLFTDVFSIDVFNTEAIRGLANACNHQQSGNEILQSFEKLISAPDTPQETIEQLHLSAGKIANDLGKWDKAFTHFHTGNKMSGGIFSTEELHAIRTVQKEVFSPSFFSQRQTFGLTDQRPVFIVGMPRSGTTLVEQILDSHPQVKGAGEMPDLGKILAEQFGNAHATPQAYRDKVTSLTDRDIKQMASAYLKALDRHSRKARRVVDKLPHNFEALGLIALMFPNAHIIHCKRDPMDTCVSCYMNQFNDQHAYTKDLTKLGQYYRDYSNLMDHWAKVLPLTIYDLQYEDLIASQKELSRALIDHIDLKWNDACLDFHQTKRTISTPSRAQVRQPIYTSSINRWKRYEKHLGELKAALSYN